MPRTIFIADAGSLLGKACAIRLGRAGWNTIMGASSLATLKSVCDELPDRSTLPYRCVPTDIGNLRPVIEGGINKFGSIDAVLLNYRPPRDGQRRTFDNQVTALTVVGQATREYLIQSEGQFLIVGQRGGPRNMSGALQTVARDAVRTMSDALAQEWIDDPIHVNLVEPNGLDGPKPMARRIARVLNGASPRRSSIGQTRLRTV